MKRFFALLLIFLSVATAARADEGMWLPSLIGSRIKDMQYKGFKLTAKDIYDINEASLKDGVVLFGRGCTGELVSAEGLLLTNHHCGFGQIQQHSSVEHDYLTNGFWAMNRAEELPNPGLTVTFLVRMEEVTDRVMAGTEKMTFADGAPKRAENIKRITADAVKGTHYEAAVEPFYYGNQYFLFVNEVYRDVRLVGAPPSSIGKFGGDTDNWMWPRHTGDFSIFRIYADKNNNPADYSPNNVPYTPKKFFHISTAGVKEGDFTMIYGFPGTTKQFIHSAEVEYVQKSNPIKIGLRTIRLDEINAASDADRAVRIAYASKAAGIANSWKKWQGESLGLERLGTVSKKRAYEARFAAWAADKPQYRTVVDDLQRLYDQREGYALVRDYYNEVVGGIELMSAVGTLLRVKDNDFSALEAFYKDYYPELDARIAAKLLAQYVTNVPADYIPVWLKSMIAEHGTLEKYVEWLYANSALVNAGNIGKVKQDDPAIVLFMAFNDMYRGQVAPHYARLTNEITPLYTTYVKGVTEFEPERDFFPDANLTLRVAYGKVEGYYPQDAMKALPVSTVDGIIEKDNPEIYDYDIPQRLRDLYASKDYGRWAVDGTVPVCFLATNHTTGGNSGSPIINGDGHLVGINFDRTWLSTMSDIEFDPAMCRNISVDIRYVLFVIDRIGGASYLFDEMVFEENIYVNAQYDKKKDVIYVRITEPGRTFVTFTYTLMQNDSNVIVSDKSEHWSKVMHRDIKGGIAYYPRKGTELYSSDYFAKQPIAGRLNELIPSFTKLSNREKISYLESLYSAR